MRIRFRIPNTAYMSVLLCAQVCGLAQFGGSVAQLVCVA
jgi:hypothetical protein